MTVAPGLTTYREGSLHAALKALYAGADGAVEETVDGFVVDVVTPSGLVEVQTASFSSVRRKLERLVERHAVTLVHPIALERWIVRVDADGAVLGRRRSPRRGLPIDLFDELVSFPGLLREPNFRLELVFIREEEVRGPVPAGARYRRPREWWRLDRRLLEVVETRPLERPEDLLELLPDGLPEPFTSADVVAATGRSRRVAMRTVYCLEKCGAVARSGMRGRLRAYERVPHADVPGSSPSAAPLSAGPTAPTG